MFRNDYFHHHVKGHRKHKKNDSESIDITEISETNDLQINKEISIGSSLDRLSSSSSSPEMTSRIDLTQSYKDENQVFLFIYLG